MKLSALKTTEDKILVKINPFEKDYDGSFQTAKEFSSNYSSRNPIVCEVIQGNHLVSRGKIILAHYNFFHEDSPFRITEHIFAIRTNENIFAWLDKDGNAHSMFGNLVCERIPMEYTLHMPPDQQKMYGDRVRIASDGCGYRKGQVVLIIQYADMPVIYNFAGKEKTIIKVQKDLVVGFIKPQTV
jgi:hypothetical protein